jgi:protein-S-isoprenylcysteine O-methyltransferase Ste14
VKKIICLLYGIACYLVLAGTALYAIGFTGNVLIAKTIDSGSQSFLLPAVLTDVALVVLFALQYSILKKPVFKRWFKKFVPAAMQRSTYVLLTCLCLLLPMWQWQPVGGIVWSTEDEVLKAILQIIYFSGWAIVFVSTFLVDHFALFGIRQVWMHFTGKPYKPLTSQLPFFYTLVRHPLYLGFVIALWSAPVMTAAHLLVAILITGYMLTMIRFKEKYPGRRMILR